MHDKTITYFCHYSSSSGDMWFPYRIENVNLKNDRSYIMKVYGSDASETGTLHIPFAVEDGKKKVGAYEYKTPKEWDRIANEEKSNFITFKGGKDFDFFVEGDLDGFTEPVTEAEYQRTGFYQHMDKTYDNVYAVSSVSGPFDLIPHFELLGK